MHVCIPPLVVVCVVRHTCVCDFLHFFWVCCVLYAWMYAYVCVFGCMCLCVRMHNSYFGKLFVRICLMEHFSQFGVFAHAIRWRLCGVSVRWVSVCGCDFVDLCSTCVYVKACACGCMFSTFVRFGAFEHVCVCVRVSASEVTSLLSVCAWVFVCLETHFPTLCVVRVVYVCAQANACRWATFPPLVLYV